MNKLEMTATLVSIGTWKKGPEAMFKVEGGTFKVPVTIEQARQLALALHQEFTLTFKQEQPR